MGAFAPLLGDNMNRICSKCNIEKDISQFNKSGWVDKRPRTFCKECEHKDYKAYVERIKKQPKIIPETKHCNTCNTTKPSFEFGKASGKKDGLKSKCKNCSKIYARKHYDKKPEMYSQTAKKCRYIKYGVNEQMAKQFAISTDGACEICGTVGKLAVDHCHEKVKFRGLICRNCNLMLGYAKDKIETLLSAVTYLGKGI